MIKKLSIAKYRMFSGFSTEIPRVGLLMGTNGTGKTSIFDVLSGIRSLVVDNGSGEDAFPLTTLSRWLDGAPETMKQEFSVTIESPHGDIVYRLELDQNPTEGKSSIASESLRDEGGLLFSFDQGTVQLYGDDHKAGARFSYDKARSALAGVAPVSDNRKLTCFRQQMSRITCLRIDAPQMEPRSEREQKSPERDFSNFASWYRSAIQRDAAAVGPFLQEMQDVIRGFRSLNLQPLGQGYAILRAKFVREENNGSPRTQPRTAPQREFDLGFDELSDGQRTLIALYAILHFLLREDAIVCLDEPDNFLALEEIQPFVHRLLDQVEANPSAQVLLASHHPQFYNTLAKDCGIRLALDSRGDVLASRYQAPPDSALPVAELIARGELT